MSFAFSSMSCILLNSAVIPLHNTSFCKDGCCQGTTLHFLFLPYSPFSLPPCPVPASLFSFPFLVPVLFSLPPCSCSTPSSVVCPCGSSSYLVSVQVRGSTPVSLQIPLYLGMLVLLYCYSSNCLQVSLWIPLYLVSWCQSVGRWLVWDPPPGLGSRQMGSIPTALPPSRPMSRMMESCPYSCRAAAMSRLLNKQSSGYCTIRAVYLVNS